MLPFRCSIPPSEYGRILWRISDLLDEVAKLPDGDQVMVIRRWVADARNWGEDEIITILVRCLKRDTHLAHLVEEIR